MSLYDSIRSDLVAAMRAGENLRRDTLRMLIAAIENRRIELGEQLTEEQVIGVLSSAVKSRADSAQQYEAAGRAELAEKEAAEIEVIQPYLPRQLSERQTREVVEAKIAELGISSKKELGRLMKAIMAEHKGALDGTTVQRLAGELLS